MIQDTKPAPFNVGDHIRYVAAENRALLSGNGDKTEEVLVHGMEGVILTSTGALSNQGEAAPQPWHCRVQFKNGFQLDITPETRADFDVTGGLQE
jgi:hypothetical protein